MSLIKYLANLGYGSRRDVSALVAARRVTAANGRILGNDSPWAHADVRVDGIPLDPEPGVVIVLNKPVEYVCSTQDVPPLVYDLLPPRFLRRKPVIAPVGRLDRDTSGLLLLTDDGALNHHLTSPRSHLPKAYRVSLASDITNDAATLFASGTLVLRGETTPLLPAALDVIDARTVRITITEGRYHQVRRMFVAIGNHVLALQRVAIGAFAPDDVPEGTWRILTPAERTLLSASPRAP